MLTAPGPGGSHAGTILRGQQPGKDQETSGKYRIKQIGGALFDLSGRYYRYANNPLTQAITVPVHVTPTISAHRQAS